MSLLKRVLILVFASTLSVLTPALSASAATVSAQLQTYQYLVSSNTEPLRTQTLTVSAAVKLPEVIRDSYSSEAPPPPPPSPPVSYSSGFEVPTNVASSGEAQAYASTLVSGDQFQCLLVLWDNESGWRVNAYNPSGAYGIPQALPGSKMGAGWQTDYQVQINWGLGYVQGRYGSPCEALQYWQNHGWY